MGNPLRNSNYPKFVERPDSHEKVRILNKEIQNGKRSHSTAFTASNTLHNTPTARSDLMRISLQKAVWDFLVMS
jgi:hypothetical protein